MEISIEKLGRQEQKLVAFTKQQLQPEARALPGPAALVRARSKVVPPSYVFRVRGA